MKYFSLFSGIGGFELGIYQADKESTCVGYSEIDPYAVKIYSSHFHHTNYGDITKIATETLPEFELLVGGFPCQSFSISGKRGGFNDVRGTLFFEICRILSAKQPRLLLLENVKGLLSHDKGKTFETIIRTLDELGYDLQWQVVNSKNHRIPQSRDRIFIVGHLRGTPRPKVFPLFGTNSKNIKVSGILDTDTWRKRHEQIRRIHDPSGISPTIPTATGGGVMTKIEPSLGVVRRLTPLECERLQGFPDNWTAGISDSQRYKCCGNAVTVNVIKAIVEKLI